MERRQLLGTAVAGAAGVVGLAAYGTYRDATSSSDRSRRPPDADGTDQSPREGPSQPEPPAEEMPVRHGDDFGTVVDMAQAGADPTGNDPIGEVLKRHARDDTLLSFPEGTYLLPQLRLTGYDHLGIAAMGDDHPTFVAPAGSCRSSDPHIQFDRITRFLLEGIDFDFQRDGAGGAINVIAAGDAAVRDVVIEGSCRDQIAMFRMDVRDPEGTGLVENVRAKHVQDSGWLTGGYVGKHHSGEVTFRNCAFSEFTDNGLYGSASGADGGGDGVVHTVDGEFRNNNVSNIRLGTAGSSARNDTIVIDSQPEIDPVNLRGIRLRRGADQVVDNCDITLGPAVTNSFGAIVFHADNGGAHVSNTHVTVNSDEVPAVHAFYGEAGGDSSPTFENVTVDGTASRGYAVELSGRDGTTFRNCTVEQSGENRDGIRLAYSADCALLDSRIEVTGAPLILRDSTLRIRNTTFVTPNGQRHIDAMTTGPGDFRPETWATTRWNGSPGGR